MITFSDRKDIEPTQLVSLFRQAPWAKTRTADDAREMLSHTDVAISAWDGPRLIGLGRVLTDFVYRASIWDCLLYTSDAADEL